jgi:hypothetical protein
MRLWSIDCQYLDAKGLVALWRETLLAKSVLRGLTKGYTNHPQLKRFNVDNINVYLFTIYNEAIKRGYNFNSKKIGDNILYGERIFVTDGQLEYEFNHLQNKLKTRCPAKFHYNNILRQGGQDLENNFFIVRKGGVADWEIIKD